jgi:hypothetical protein
MGQFMKRVMTGLAVVAAGLIATGVFAGAASAAGPLRPPGVPANYVLYKTISSGVGECNSAGVSFEQQGLITAFVCDQIEAPSFNSGGESQLWALLP